MNKIPNRLWRIILMSSFAVTQPLGVSAKPSPKLEFSSYEMKLAEAVADDPGLAAFYGAHDLKPVFSGPEAKARRVALLDAIATAPQHGLPTQRYKITGLDPDTVQNDVSSEVRFARVLSLWAHDVANGLVDPEKTDSMNKRAVVPVDMASFLVKFTEGNPSEALAELPPHDPAYLKLKEMLAEQASLVAPPGTPEVASGVYRIGVSDPAVSDLRQRLASIGFVPATSPVDSEIFDEDLAGAVSAYQKAANLPADGIAGPNTLAHLNGISTGPQTRRLMIAMERLRWLNGYDLNSRMVWVNIPSYIAEIREGGKTVFESRAVVGRPDPDWETPEFSDTMEFVVVNPYWNVPSSIAAASYLPKLRSNRNAFSHLDVVNRRGQVVARSSIDFSKYTASNFPYRLRQKPSDDNALGVVKFMFPNPWNIYLHDTPSKGLFSASNRAASHGCIRIAKPLDLAYELLRGNSSDPQAFFERARAREKEQWIKLDEPLPVHLVYLTAVPGPGGRLKTYRDIYGRDARVWSAMKKAAEAGS